MDATAIATHPSLRTRPRPTRVFSNAALHWVLGGERGAEARAETFFHAVHDLLVPGGVFAFEMGGLGNVCEMRTALVMALARRVGLPRAREADPWFFPDEGWVTDMLETRVGGWRVERVEREWRPTETQPGTGGLEGWVRLMGAPFFDALAAGESGGREEKEDGSESGSGSERRREECIREVVDVLEGICRTPRKTYMMSYVRLRVLARRV